MREVHYARFDYVPITSMPTKISARSAGLRERTTPHAFCAGLATHLLDVYRNARPTA